METMQINGEMEVGWGEDRQGLTFLKEMGPGEYLKQQEWVGVGWGQCTRPLCKYIIF